MNILISEWKWEIISKCVFGVLWIYLAEGGGCPLFFFLFQCIFWQCYFSNILGQIEYFSFNYMFFNVFSMVQLMLILVWEWVFWSCGWRSCLLKLASTGWEAHSAQFLANGMDCIMSLSCVTTDLRDCDDPSSQAKQPYLHSCLSSRTLRKSTRTLISSFTNLHMDLLSVLTVELLLGDSDTITLLCKLNIPFHSDKSLPSRVDSLENMREKSVLRNKNENKAASGVYILPYFSLHFFRKASTDLLNQEKKEKKMPNFKCIP